jgi:hypothetical protein
MEKMNPKTKDFEEIRGNMVQSGYREQSKTISVKKANYLSLLITVPFLLLFIFLYEITNGEVFTILDYSISQIFIFIVSALFSIVIHEGLHGLSWGAFCQNGMKSIGFGVMWSSFTPYCHCKEPLNYHKYLIGALMPFIVLGIGITVFGLLNGNLFIFWLGLFNILGAGGDLLIAVMLGKFKKGKIVDHPTEIGFIAYIK